LFLPGKGKRVLRVLISLRSIVFCGRWNLQGPGRSEEHGLFLGKKYALRFFHRIPFRGRWCQLVLDLEDLGTVFICRELSLKKIGIEVLIDLQRLHLVVAGFNLLESGRSENFSNWETSTVLGGKKQQAVRVTIVL